MSEVDNLRAIVAGYNLNAHQTTECVREAKIADLQVKLEQEREEGKFWKEHGKGINEALILAESKIALLEKDKAELYKTLDTALWELTKNTGWLGTPSHEIIRRVLIKYTV